MKENVLGKYAASPAGHDVPEHMVPHVAIVWTERRSDRDGPFWVLYSIPMPEAAQVAANV